MTTNKNLQIRKENKKVEIKPKRPLEWSEFSNGWAYKFPSSVFNPFWRNETIFVPITKQTVNNFRRDSISCDGKSNDT